MSVATVGEVGQVDSFLIGGYRVLDVRPGVARKAGGEGVRYLCRISGQERELWYAHGQWFVEGASVELAAE